jgi:hypothetical protein
MSLTLGTDTYITLTDARTYCSDNDLATLPDVDADAEKLLKRATKALDRIYGNKYLGYASVASQPLYWPRTLASANTAHGEGEVWLYTVDSDGNPRNLTGIPRELGYAVTELALMLQSGEDVYTQPPPSLKEEVNKIDTLESRKVYNSANGYADDSLYVIKLILRPLLKTADNGITMSRGK